MQRFRNEHTIASSCEIHGRGYWSGEEVTVAVHPAPVSSGIRFIRTDLPGRPSCLANASTRQDASLRTNLVEGEAKFQMVEHLMAALSALEIDNCNVEINGEELPGLDGSSLGFAHALARAGLIIQAAPRRRLVLDQRYRVSSGDGWIEATPSKRQETYFEYHLSFDDDTPIEPQAFSIELTPNGFLREVASARTFVTADQADQIRAAGLASHVTNQDIVVIGSSGPVDNEFRFRNECARHKTLDLIGDLALSGIDVAGRFTSFRGGHKLNGKMASLLADLSAKQSARSLDAAQDIRKVA
ncbi:UDP-3-O-acyl-N-acetylglucosamine deacetylase [Rubripirellula amarantea]|uniref:UDP-3-O-acyl-N-acetylglucosamine deacetylase n=1 Tax=Rubripirellula amarantea TaxID=2527999 RepID=UPI0011B4318F|nr:UDP-3-O-acyl-N-acetylglucosamine deacetylase [Rubripirellula amarantea]